MAAEIIEAQPESANLDQLPTDEAAKTPDELVNEFQATGDPLPGETPQPAEEDLPDKYKGKTIKEVVAMHQEAEKALGRQGSEVGELRKVVDNYIQSQTSQQSEPSAPPEEPVDFFENPEKAVSQAIENHPEVKAARQASTDMRRQTSLSQMQAKHPDMQEILGDPKFSEWIQASPMRMQMFQMADRDYNFEAADELISGYKERVNIAQQTVKVEEQARKQQVKAAQTGGATGANTAGARRVYRRADIIKLMKDDPERYEALSGEIMQAYAEGRVK